MYALIQTGGKQYKIEEGQLIKVEKLEAREGEEVTFDQVLAVNRDGDLQVGTPLLDGARVVGEVISQGKDKKIVVFKYKAKKNYRRKKGHRQPYTAVKIQSIQY